MAEKRYGSQIPVRIELLKPENKHYTKDFYCDNKAIDNYFRKVAAFDETAVTYLFIDTDEDSPIACVTLACSAIFTTETEDQFSTIQSAMEILYFAVDENYKHIPYIKGSPLTLSHYILSYMLNQMREYSHTVIGASKVVLYSVPTAVHFYERCDFKEFGNTMYGDKGYFVDECIPMYFDLN